VPDVTMQHAYRAGLPTVAPASIQAGDVIHFRQAPLAESTAVTFSKYVGDDKPRPHLCVVKNDHYSLWTSITSVRKDERLLIKKEWRTGGVPHWRMSSAVWLYDGSFFIVGPTHLFCMAAQGLEMLDIGSRARITEEGMNAVLWEVFYQQKRRPEIIDNMLEAFNMKIPCPICG